MLGNILIVLSIIGFALVALEVFLSEAKKSALTSAILHAWTALDDLKKTRWLDWLRRHNAKALIVLAAAASMGFLLLWAYLNRAHQSDGIFDMVFLTVIAGAGFGIGYLFIRLTLNATTLVAAFIRATLFLAAALAPLASTVWFAHFARADLIVTGEPTFLQMFWLISFIFAAFVTAELVIAWASVAIPLATILFFQSALASAEFVLRRLAEYPKGPIFAASLLIGAIALVIKAFMPPLQPTAFYFQFRSARVKSAGLPSKRRITPPWSSTSVSS